MTAPEAIEEVEAAVSRLLRTVPQGGLIDGTWQELDGREEIDVSNPATGRTLIHVVESRQADGLAALDAAARAQSGWAEMPSRARAELLRRCFDLLLEKADDVALLITLEMGKPLREAQAEVAYGAEFLRWFSEQAAHIGGSYRHAPDGESRLFTHRQPVGPSLLITPWNFPLAMATRKVGAALAAGCTMVLKPSELTPLTSLFLAQLLQEAGLPPGVLNVVVSRHAASLVEPIMADPRLRKVSFTGSTPVGKLLLRQGAQNVLRSSMELGGNAPLIVLEDADLELAVDQTVLAKLRNMGQSCVAANRILVHADVVDHYVESLAARMASLRVGNGLDPSSDVGPLIDSRQRDKVEQLVGDAVHRGARLIVDGGSRPGEGWFYEPTLMVDVPVDARIAHEEVFGPVAAISTFESEQEALERANATEFGLVAYVFTQDVARGLRLGERLETGMVGINKGVVSNPAAPFGGVKHSGIGREGGDEGVDEYLVDKYIALPV